MNVKNEKTQLIFNKLISLKLAEQDLETIRNVAESQNISVSEFIRKAIDLQIRVCNKKQQQQMEFN